VSERPEGWYDKGGVIPPAVTWVRNDTGAPIVVCTAEQIRAGHDYMKRTYGEPTNDAKDVD
jgi:hypothetical protein